MDGRGEGQGVSWNTIVIVCSIVVYLYLLVTEWVDLAPWNDVSASTAGQKLSGSLVNLVPFGLLIAAFVVDLDGMKILAIAVLVVWLGVHFAWWWAPYWWGASETHMESYRRLFSHTYKFLPSRGRNPVPDAHYVTLQILTLINTLIAALALARG